MGCRALIFGLGCSVTATLVGQSISVSPSGTPPGGAFRSEISYHPGPKLEATAIQWDIEIAASEFEILNPKGPVATPAAVEKGKSVTCLGSWRKAPKLYVYRCMLAGGVAPVPEGPFAVIELKPRPQAQPGEAPAKLDRAVAADRTGRQLKLKIESPAK